MNIKTLSINQPIYPVPWSHTHTHTHTQTTTTPTTTYLQWAAVSWLKSHDGIPITTTTKKNTHQTTTYLLWTAVNWLRSHDSTHTHPHNPPQTTTYLCWTAVNWLRIHDGTYTPTKPPNNHLPAVDCCKLAENSLKLAAGVARCEAGGVDSPSSWEGLKP